MFMFCAECNKVHVKSRIAKSYGHALFPMCQVSGVMLYVFPNKAFMV